jgi:hypothetical protein
MLKQEVASLSARVALLESQKRDLELANKDLAERLADLATNTTNDKRSNLHHIHTFGLGTDHSTCENVST